MVTSMMISFVGAPRAGAFIPVSKPGRRLRHETEEDR
jgi:hypothetical protein